MEVYQVQLWPDGKWDGKPYQQVEAPSEKAAAEKIMGRPLATKGSNFKIRARVRPFGRLIGEATVFYEP
jgi:hypothetical protein